MTYYYVFDSITGMPEDGLKNNIRAVEEVIANIGKQRDDGVIIAIMRSYIQQMYSELSRRQLG